MGLLMALGRLLVVGCGECGGASLVLDPVDDRLDIVRGSQHQDGDRLRKQPRGLVTLMKLRVACSLWEMNLTTFF